MYSIGMYFWAFMVRLHIFWIWTLSRLKSSLSLHKINWILFFVSSARYRNKNKFWSLKRRMQKKQGRRPWCSLHFAFLLAKKVIRLRTRCTFAAEISGSLKSAQWSKLKFFWKLVNMAASDYQFSRSLGMA